MKRCLGVLFVVEALIAASAVAGTVAVQDFDGGTPTWNYGSDVTPFDNGWGSDGYFGTIDLASASPLSWSGFSGTIFGENDLSDEGDNGTNGFATLSFSNVNISAVSGVQVSFEYQVDGYSAGDDVKYEVFHDGVGQGSVLLFDGGVSSDTGATVTVSIPDLVNEVGLTVSIKNNGASGFSGLDGFKVEDGVTPPEVDLGPGSVAFVGFDADGDSFAFTVLERIPEGQQITFTDAEWDGAAFDSSDYVVWAAPDGGVAPGMVFTNEGLTLNATDEALFAVRGPVASPVAFLAALSSDGDNGFGTLSGTGLSNGTTAVDFSSTAAKDDDVMAYTGARLINGGYYSEFLPLINDPANWISEDGTGNQGTNGVPPDLPFDTTPFLAIRPTVFVVR
jgi:hypothetical protein